MNSSLEIINGVSKVTGLGVKATKELFEAVKSVLVHEIACEALDYEEGRLKTANICVPNLGNITVDIEKGEISNCQFKMDKQFGEAIKSAIVSGESELLKRAEETMVFKIKERYESLI